MVMQRDVISKMYSKNHAKIRDVQNKHLIKYFLEKAIISPNILVL